MFLGRLLDLVDLLASDLSKHSLERICCYVGQNIPAGSKLFSLILEKIFINIEKRYSISGKFDEYGMKCQAPRGKHFIHPVDVR